MHEATITDTTPARVGALAADLLCAHATRRGVANLDAALGCLARLTREMEETQDARVAAWAAELRWIGDRMAEELPELGSISFV